MKSVELVLDISATNNVMRGTPGGGGGGALLNTASRQKNYENTIFMSYLACVAGGFVVRKVKRGKTSSGLPTIFVSHISHFA